MTAAAIAEMLIAAIELARLSALLLSEDRDPTEEESARVKANVQRANDLWEAVG